MTPTRRLVLAGFLASALALNWAVRGQGSAVGSFCPILVNPQTIDTAEN